MLVILISDLPRRASADVRGDVRYYSRERSLIDDLEF
jgi:hypothetical protein